MSLKRKIAPLHWPHPPLSPLDAMAVLTSSNIKREISVITSQSQSLASVCSPNFLASRLTSLKAQVGLCLSTEYTTLRDESLLEGSPSYSQYRVIFKKVSFGIFRTILVSKEENNFTIESKDRGLSLSEFLWYLGIVKIIKIRHSKGHISQTNHDLKNFFVQKSSLDCCFTCTKYSSFC